MAANFFKRYGTNPGGFMGTRVWNQARSIGMEPGPFHTLQKVWNRRPFHRYGTDHVPGVARIRKIRGLILHDRTIPVPYPGVRFPTHTPSKGVVQRSVPDCYALIGISK